MSIAPYWIFVSAQNLSYVVLFPANLTSNLCLLVLCKYAHVLQINKDQRWERLHLYMFCLHIVCMIFFFFCIIKQFDSIIVMNKYV